jgi:hypothetical protein
MLNEWTTPAPVRAMILRIRPADALVLWEGIETAETHAARGLVGAWLRACVAVVHGIEGASRHRDTLPEVRRIARIASADLYRRIADAGFFRSPCGHAAEDSWHDQVDGRRVIRCGVCEESAGEVWP